MAADVIHGAGATMPRHKPEYSDLCDICGPTIAERKARGQRVAAFHRSFIEFGYATLTLAETAAAYDKAMLGKPTDGDVIALLIHSQLVEAGVLA
jgi:hypothetical protein